MVDEDSVLNGRNAILFPSMVLDLRRLDKKLGSQASVVERFPHARNTAPRQALRFPNRERAGRAAWRWIGGRDAASCNVPAIAFFPPRVIVEDGGEDGYGWWTMGKASGMLGWNLQGDRGALKDLRQGSCCAGVRRNSAVALERTDEGINKHPSVRRPQNLPAAASLPLPQPSPSQFRHPSRPAHDLRLLTPTGPARRNDCAVDEKTSSASSGM